MAETLTEKKSPFYSVLRVLANIVFHTIMPVRIHGREKLDGWDPPYILIANHVHALDPVVMAMAIRKHECAFLGKKELGKNPAARYLLTKLHCIFVDRHNRDMEAMRSCMKAIRMKMPLPIFPEGTRHHERQMEQIENGTALIALRSRVPIIPMYFSRKLGLFRVAHLHVGDPIPTEDLLEEGINTATCEKMNERIRTIYREMVRQYGDPYALSKRIQN